MHRAGAEGEAPPGTARPLRGGTAGRRRCEVVPRAWKSLSIRPFRIGAESRGMGLRRYRSRRVPPAAETHGCGATLLFCIAATHGMLTGTGLRETSRALP